MQSSIIQKYFGPEDKYELSIIWGSDFMDRIKDFNYHFTVYIDGFHPQVLLKASSNSPFQEKWPVFKDCIKKMPKVDFSDMVLLCTLFPIQTSFGSIIDIIDKIGEYSNNCNEWHLFPETYGRIIYCHQLEQLYCMLSGGSMSEGVNFRKEWNWKKPSSRDMAHRLKISTDQSLFCFLERYMLSHQLFVFTANLHGGWLLWKHLQQTEQ